jgi:glycerophosphoryl diester phosphodiesterase
MTQSNSGDNLIRVAHRGLLNGPNPQKENTIEQINEAISKGYYVELDVRLIDNEFYLGHDNPCECVCLEFLENEKIFTHCKDKASWELLKDNPLVNCFLHDEEDYCITSRGYKWNHIKFWPHIFYPDENGNWEFVGAYSKLW